MKNDTSDMNKATKRPPRYSASYESTPDTLESFRKTQDGAIQYRPVRVNQLQGTSHPPEESMIIKGLRTTDHPTTGIKANSLTNKRELRTLDSLSFHQKLT
uniref:Uncharacterized protein n=1 Tax=Musa acuminata subsp. malaccensis TaxID=214687 RepID=A0A804JLJ5_MUSAM